MNKIILCSLVMFIALPPHVSAASYKGHSLFKRKCFECHSEGLKFIKGKTTFEWEEIMEKKGMQVANIHFELDQKDEDFKYFRGSKYKRDSRHYLDFFLEYASDSGNVPACD